MWTFYQAQNITLDKWRRIEESEEDIRKRRVRVRKGVVRKARNRLRGARNEDMSERTSQGL